MFDFKRVDNHKANTWKVFYFDGRHFKHVGWVATIYGRWGGMNVKREISMRPFASREQAARSLLNG